MKYETFKEAWKWLEKYQGRSLTDFAINVYWKEFEDMDEEIFCRSIVKSYEIFPPGRFPTISDLRGLFSGFRESNWNKEKQTHAPKQKSGMGREAISLILRRWLDNNNPRKLDSYQLAAEMIVDLEEKYPGFGWGAHGKALLKWLEKYEENKEKREEIAKG